MTGIISDNVGRTSGLIKAASGGGGVWTLIKTLTASGDGDLSFVDGTDDVVLDSTYPIYLFKFINIHPASASTLGFNLSIDSGSNYNVAKTTSDFITNRAESDSGNDSVYYETALDLAQGTGVQKIANSIGNLNDDCAGGELWLFGLSSTTFVKHFICTSVTSSEHVATYNMYIAGYGNTTSAVDAVQFSMSSGNIDAGKIKLYGLKDSA
jgi:hypothetical protein